MSRVTKTKEEMETVANKVEAFAFASACGAGYLWGIGGFFLVGGLLGMLCYLETYIEHAIKRWVKHEL